MKSYHELLREVRDSLTQDNWDKYCMYFSIKNNKLYMSAHGAAQRLVNPQIAKALAVVFAVETAVSLAAASAARRATRAADAADATLEKNNIPNLNFAFAGYRTAMLGAYHGGGHFTIWKNRPDWVGEDYISNNKNYGNTNLHFLMGMFGLTQSLENQKSTTLDMIQERLSEAAIWAEENEEFLMNNM